MRHFVAFFSCNTEDILGAIEQLKLNTNLPHLICLPVLFYCLSLNAFKRLHSTVKLLEYLIHTTATADAIVFLDFLFVC